MANYSNGAHKLVITRTPHRISFAGGGTDFGSFYRQGKTGAVISTAVNKYVYVTVKRHSRLFNECIRLNYSETELVSSVDSIRNDIARSCLKLLGEDGPIYISTISDIPSASGLGSSSSFAVGLLNALHAIRGEWVSAGQLADEACQVEIDMLNHPIGKQDQFAVAYGGLNYIIFNPNETVAVSAVKVAPNRLKQLFGSMILFWTGQTRSSSSILQEQKQNTVRRSNIDYLSALRRCADDLVAEIAGTCDLNRVGEILDYAWQQKRRLASTISSDWIDDIYRRAIASGALGGKLCGAGGGGFMLFVVPEDRREPLRRALPDLTEISFGFEPEGSRVLFPNL
jgi:D-glycero-alpha-D-manno-heptose-7-phosphate kinase